MRFIQEDTGAEYELVPGAHQTPTNKVIRPVKEPKWEVGIKWPKHGMDTEIKVKLLDFTTVDQAQLIKKSVEELMIAITTNKYAWSDLESAYNKAHFAMKGDK